MFGREGFRGDEESEVDIEVIYVCVMLLHVGCAETL